VPYLVYDFLDANGRSVIAQWIKKSKIITRDIGQLNQKLDMLRLNGFDLHPNLLAGPIKKQKQIYKLVIHGQRMLRPMLCKGPFQMDSEFTLLLGAIEVNFVLDNDPQDATANREILLRNSGRRKLNVRY
jgi:hypothetical protein